MCGQLRQQTITPHSGLCDLFPRQSEKALKMKALILIPTLILTLVSTAQADTHTEDPSSQHRLFSYGKIGTMGAGIGLGYVINDDFSLRAGINSRSSQSGKRRIDGNRYDVSRKTGVAAEALLDWYPLSESGFRVSGGLMLMNSSATLSGKADSQGNFIINHNTYSAAEIGRLSGKVRSPRVAPYLGVGWDSGQPGQAGWRVISSVGVIHHRSRNVELNTSGMSDNGILQQDLKAERSRIKAVNDISLEASIGLAYTF